MKKFYTSFLICILIIICIVPAYANGFGGGTHGPGGFGSSGFSGSSTDSRLTWDGLSSLELDVNTRIANGEFSNLGTSFSATIYYDSSNDIYAIRALVGSTYYYFHNLAGGIYYCDGDDAPSGLPSWFTSIYTRLGGQLDLLNNIYDYTRSIYNVGYDIRAYCSTISSNITTAVTKLSSIDGKLNYLSSLDTFVETTLNNNIVANGTAIATWGQAILDKLGTVNSNQNTGIMGLLNQIKNGITLNNDVSINIHRLLAKENQDGEPTFNALNYNPLLTDSTKYIEISQGVADQLVAYFMENVNTPITVMRDGQTPVDCDYVTDVRQQYYDVHAQHLGRVIAMSCGYEDLQHNYLSYYSYLGIRLGHDDYIYIIQNTAGNNNTTFDDSDIIAALEALDVDLDNIQGDIQNIISQANPNLYAASTNSGEFKISKKVADNIIAYINTECLGKPVNYVTTNGTLTTYYIRGAYFNTSNNRIRVTMENANGTAFSTTCYLCNKYRYHYTVENDNIESAIVSIPNKVDNVVTKLDDILDWLDNADLLTNEDLQELLTEFENDIKDGDTKIKHGIKLFKATFGHTDDEYDLGDFNRCIQFMKDFWEGYENE